MKLMYEFMSNKYFIERKGNTYFNVRPQDNGFDRAYDFENFANIERFITENMALPLQSFIVVKKLNEWYRYINGTWEEVSHCNYCNKLFPINELHEYRHERTAELLCESHLEMLEAK